MMGLKLKDKVVFITDGDSPTGISIAKLFREEGAILAINVYPSAAAPGEDFGPGPGRCDMVTRANAASKKEIDAAVASVLEKFGRIDVLVHNNNEVIPEKLEYSSDESFDRALDINAKSAFLYAQAAGAAMKKAGSGCFVFISSIHDEKPSGAAFAYSIAKGAVKMLVKELVLELGKHNVRANLVNPGPMEGQERLFFSDLSPLYEHTKERIANGKYITAEEVANAALFFAGDGCPQANGSELKVDGGFLYSYITRRKPPQSPEDSMTGGTEKSARGGK